MPVVREVCTQEPEDLPELRSQDCTGAGGENLEMQLTVIASPDEIPMQSE